MPSARMSRDAQLLLDSLGELPAAVNCPIFIALSGLPGTGKTYFGRALAQRIPLVMLESDALRKVLFPQPVYSGNESSRLFRAINNLIEVLLRRGVSLILDATNLTEWSRKKLYHIATNTGARLILVRIQASQARVRERLEARLHDQSSYSDADWEVYQLMKPRVERIKHKHYVVDTTRDITPILDKIVEVVQNKRS